MPGKGVRTAKVGNYYRDNYNNIRKLIRRRSFLCLPQAQNQVADLVELKEVAVDGLHTKVIYLIGGKEGV